MDATKGDLELGRGLELGQEEGKVSSNPVR